MSEMERKKGIATIIHVPENFSWKESIEYLQGKGYNIEIDSEEFEWFESEQIEFVDGVWYLIEVLSTEAEGWIEGKKINNRQYEFDCYWYNGGGSFNEVLDSAIGIANETKS